jgi:HEAT repeat protein
MRDTHSATGPDTGITGQDRVPVEEVLRALAAALRGYRLYARGNPMLDRFVTALRQKIAELWQHLPLLRLEIEEDRIRWEGHDVYRAGEAAVDLPFLFYQDGIRELTMLPGFEDGELVSLLEVLARAPAVRREEDDLVTLLWQEDLTNLRYEVVEAEGEVVELAASGAASAASVDAATVRSEAEGARGVTAGDFQEALYFLDDAELRRLREEIGRENARDLWRDVLDGLLDRFEDGSPERQRRILAILRELLPSSLASGDFTRAAALLEELVAVAGRPDRGSDAVTREISGFFDVLGSEETIVQLASILEEMPERLGEDAVVRLLGYFPPRSIGALMRAAERVERPAVRRAFEACVQRLAEGNRDQVTELLKGSDPTVQAGALRWIGRLEIGSAVAEVVRFLRHPDATVRLAAVESLVAIRAAASANALVPLLEDSDRDVRVAAARALGALTYAPARQPLEVAISSRRLRDADRSEKVAFFEAFGRLAGPAGVPLLDRMLNARSWLGRAEASEVRACAALALAQIRHPAARDALDTAASDADPVVRTAVARAIRGGPG